jgi:Cholesterol oxidase, substrate-binding/FAD binding domain
VAPESSSVDSLPAYRRLLVQTAEEHGYVPEVAATRAAATAVAPGPAPAARVAAAAPPDWPTNIPVALVRFTNWSGETDVSRLWQATPATEAQVVDICNWAARHGWAVRPVGNHHNWSPLVAGGDATGANLVLVSTAGLNSTSFSPGSSPRVTLGAGVTIEAATAFLQQQDNKGSGAAPGYTFLNFTAPGVITLGGALAVGAHGTGIPLETEPQLDGTLSNLVTSFTAVVAESSGQYHLQTFDRSGPDAAAFLVNLGRAFITSATMVVVPNYYLQVTNLYPSTDVLFQSPSGNLDPQSFSRLVQTYGRVEVIWFPFTDVAWVKVWARQDKAVQPQVAGPYNYPWTNNIEKWESDAIAFGLRRAPLLTPYVLQGGNLAAWVNAPEGAQLNGTSRDLLLYVKPTTARYSMIGYTLQVSPDSLQAAAHDFFTRLQGSIEAAGAKWDYPVNGPVEIRVTTTDKVSALGVSGAAPATLSVCNPVDQSSDVVIWVDSLTFPGTAGSGEFYQAFEQWMLTEWGKTYRKAVRPEWSKGWAYSAAGPWTNQQTIASLASLYPGFADAAATYRRYDASNIFTNPFLAQLFPK